MLPVNCDSHVDYQNFVVTNFRKYYPNLHKLKTPVKKPKKKGYKAQPVEKITVDQL